MKPGEIISSGILELYSMGLTSPEETAQVVAWAQEFPEVAAEIDAIQSGLESYAQAQAVAPAPAVKEKLFAAINADAAPDRESGFAAKQTAPVYSISPAWKYAAAASIILLLGSLVLNYNFYNKINRTSEELAAVKISLEEQKSLASGMEADMKVMTEKNAMHVKLDGMPNVPDATARIYWMQNTKEVYVDPSDLPAVPAGKQYQFWAIVNGKPVNGGIITREINGKIVHVQKMASFGRAEAFAISIEDAGPEKPVPSEVVSMGKM